MKPPPFRYVAPRSLDEALDALAEAGDEGKVLAGGQSLIPLLNMRLAAPAVLVDINRVEGLGGIEPIDGAIQVGATVRHRGLERDEQARAALPLLGQALAHVAHPVIRNRGTTLGSIAHADPAGEMPTVLALLDGSVELRSRDGARTVAASDYFLGPLEADTRPGELAVACRFPIPEGRWGSAFEELARRHGDYALAGVAAVVTLDDHRQVSAAKVGFTGVGPVPIVVDLEPLIGQPVDVLDTTEAVAMARGAIEPEDDIHATADYRRHLAGVLSDRALRTATRRAAEGSDA